MTISIDKLIRCKRKTIAIMVSKEGKVIIKAPFGASEKFINELVRQRRDWIIRKKEDMKQKAFPIRSYQNGSEIILFDVPHKIETVPNFEYAMKCSNKTIYISEELLPDIKKFLPQMIKAICKKKFYARTSEWLQKMGLSAKAVKVSSANTRWGSCSAKGNINLNWRLALAPTEILDYIIVHELCHLKEMNHSKKFWRLVEFYFPNYKAARKWLNDNGQLLDV